MKYTPPRFIEILLWLALWFVLRVLPNGRLVIRCVTGGRTLVVSPSSVSET